MYTLLLLEGYFPPFSTSMFKAMEKSPTWNSLIQSNFNNPSSSKDDLNLPIS